MANAPINRPAVFQSGAFNYPKTRSAQTDGSNTFSFQQFVVLTSGALVKLVDTTGTHSVSVYGLTPDASHIATDEAYTQPYGEIHNVVDLSGNTLILMNITDGSGTEGIGSTTQANVTVGTRYAGRYGAVSTNTLMLNSADSGTATKNMFQVVALYNTATYGNGCDAAGDFNGRAVIKVIDSAIQ